jgi:FkbM family methyltransferase
VARVERSAGTDFARCMRNAAAIADELTSGASRVRLLLAGLLFGTMRRRRPVTLTVDVAGEQVEFVVPDHSGFLVLGEMFMTREYDIDLAPPPAVILDLGANIGASALFFRRKWPSARIVAVEPSPELAAILRRNAGSLGVEVREAAVAAETGEISFYPSDESWAGSTRDGDGHGAALRVPAVAFDELVGSGVDLVKIDVEGEEFNVIPASRRLGEVAAIVGEVHARPDSPESEQLLSHLSGFDVTINDPGPRVHFTVFHAVRRAAGSA